jgi:hypothetical protein
MSHQKVRELIEETVKRIDDSILFAYASASDFNAIGAHEDKRVHLEPLKQDMSFTDDTNTLTTVFDVGIIFYKLDDKAGANEETTAILDEMDNLSSEFIKNLNFNILNTDITSNEIVMTGMNKEAVIKVTASCMSGWVLTFKLEVADTIDYCE